MMMMMTIIMMMLLWWSVRYTLLGELGGPRGEVRLEISWVENSQLKRNWITSMNLLSTVLSRTRGINR